MGFNNLIPAETWFAILFTVMAEIVPGEVRAVVVGLFLFIMDNVGGNVAIVVDPVQEALGYRTALIIFFPCLVGISKLLSRSVSTLLQGSSFRCNSVLCCQSAFVQKAQDREEKVERAEVII